MRDEDIHTVIALLTTEVEQWKVPVVGQMATGPSRPFRVLISCLLSLRTKDETTRVAAERLFRLAQTPAEMVQLDAETIAQTIYPVGFYRTKAAQILRICQLLLERYDARVPDDIDTLLTLPGVGRKTANLVVTLGYGKPGICVDTHVHRITNRWGYVQTKSPEETEMVLRKKLPSPYWIRFNDLLVTFGQHRCKPISPFCSRCPLTPYCARVGVSRHR
ncbi:MAG: endonuclease III [Nitrospinota bacterium]|nr:MAG: endonuclease III [Nitrospinota bacterium]